jgi:uncharacterized protein YbgA (DUF1722 family)/uncharacterized protein YbbK (DUF523 family)
MRSFAKPRVVVSKCLEFAACRYNGVKMSDDLVRQLKGHVDFQPVCPECGIGLGVPRDPIRIVETIGARRLVQPATGRDVSDAMRRFAGDFVAGLGAVDGFILKGRSPSCGIKDVKLWRSPEAESPCCKTTGLFAEAVLNRFGDLPVEDEGRLQNFVLREHFLTKLFALAEFRELSGAAAMCDLVAFHARQKWLLMAYSEAQARALGRIVANHANRPPAEVYAAYRPALAKALARPPRVTAIVNVLLHAFGYVSDGLAAAEKAFFLDVLEKYREGKIPLSAATAVLKSWAVRFQADNLMEQTFLDPYPEALVAITDSGKGRDR